MGIMSDWFIDTPESRRMLAEEHVILAASELVAEALEVRGVSRTTPSILTGSRVALVSNGEDAYADFECTACGNSLRGQREVVAVSWRGGSPGIGTFSLVHNRQECVDAVT